MKLPKLPPIISNSVLPGALALALVAPSAFAQNQPTETKGTTPQRSDQIKQGQGQPYDRPDAQSQASTEVSKFILDAAKGNMMEVKMGRLALEKAQSPAVKQYGQTLVTDHIKANQQLVPLAQKKGVTLPSEVQGQLSESAQVATVPGENKTGTTLDRQPVREAVTDQNQKAQDRAGISTSDQERRLTRDQPRRNIDGTTEAHPDKQDAAMALQKLEGLSGTQFDQAFLEHSIMAHEKCIKKLEEAVRSLNDTEVKAFASSTLPTLRQHLQQAQGLKTAIPNPQKE